MGTSELEVCKDAIKAEIAGMQEDSKEEGGKLDGVDSVVDNKGMVGIGKS